MNNLQVFRNEQFGSVRAINKDGEPWFVGKDVATTLGYSNASKAVMSHVDSDDKQFIMLNIADSQNGNVPIGQSKTAIINESGLYSLILSSKLPQAKQFKRWVTSEVLPSIRKNGGYIAGQDSMTDDELMAAALLMANKKIKERDARVQELEGKVTIDAPKVIFADSVTASKTSILIGELAKLLKQNGVDIGQKRLFEWLRGNGYLIKRKGSEWNMPTQRAMEMNLFEIKETAITHSNGNVTISRTVKVTGKGQIYFINKFLSKTKENVS